MRGKLKPILPDENFANATLTRGHGVASGKNFDSRFPDGTLAMQAPFFKERGLDLSHYFNGTLNLNLFPFKFHFKNPAHYFPGIKWSEHLPAENFSFFNCVVHHEPEMSLLHSLLYWPHPSTKPEFTQSESIVEIIAPKIGDIKYGDKLRLSAQTNEILFIGK